MVYLKTTQRSSGFTLMEVMVVIAIVGIMSAIAIPNFISWLPDYRLRSATRDIVSCFQKAKLRAVKENTRVVLIFDHLNEEYTAFVDNVPANWALDGAETVVRHKSMPAGIDIQANPSTSAYTYGYNGRGLAVGGGGTVQINNEKSNSSRIVINNAGNIRTE